MSDANATLEAVRAELHKVCGTYTHPEALDDAVFKALQSIAELVLAVPVNAEVSSESQRASRAFQRFLAKHTLMDVDPDIADAADEAAGLKDRIRELEDANASLNTQLELETQQCSTFENQAAALQARVDRMRKHAALFNKECCMCGSDADELWEYFKWHDVREALRAIPDITLSKWACSPGEPWEPTRKALKQSRIAAGFDLDSDLDAFDLASGMLMARIALEETEADAG